MTTHNQCFRATKEKYHNFSSENEHFYSREILLYIAWACFRNGKVLCLFFVGEKEEYMIRVAMTEWEKYTCVRFKPATRKDRNIVRFQNGQG